MLLYPALGDTKGPLRATGAVLTVGRWLPDTPMNGKLKLIFCPAIR